jgi:glycosyltransferase involved in cell wall biosynthesis
LRVIIPIYDLHKGGGQKALSLIANALTEAGHNVVVVMPQSAQPTMHYPVQATITLVPAIEAPYLPCGDLILPNLYLNFPPAFQACPKQCVRLSFGFEPHLVDDPLALWTYQQGVPVISNSHWVDQQIVATTGRQSRVVHNGIDPAIFHPKKDPIPYLPQQPIKICYIARPVHPAKRYHDFLQSIRFLKGAHGIHPLLFLIWTEGCISPPTDLPHHSFFPQSDHEMAHIYRMSDLFVSTSSSEGFPLPHLEAMACGTPVVTTNSGGMNDSCTHQHNALIVPPGDIPAIAQGIADVIFRPRQTEKMIQNGIATSHLFTEEEYKRKIVSVLEELHRSL